MAEEAYEIKVVSRNRKTGEEIVNVSPEYMARAIYGDKMIDAAISKLEIKNGSR